MSANQFHSQFRKIIGLTASALVAAHGDGRELDEKLASLIPGERARELAWEVVPHLSGLCKITLTQMTIYCNVQGPIMMLSPDVRKAMESAVDNMIGVMINYANTAAEAEAEAGTAS